MRVTDILNAVNETKGTNAKLDILRANGDNETLKRALKLSLDQSIQFWVKKVPKINLRIDVKHPRTDAEIWELLFNVLEMCQARELTGNAARDAICNVLVQVTPEDEYWMRRLIQKKSAVGIARTTTNKVFPGLITTFKVQLADKWNEKTAKKMPKNVFLEPKLDGIRLLSIVRDGACESYARSGKRISNFDDTIGAQLATWPEGVYDGEVMDEDFTALMRQYRRQTGANVSKSYLTIFDYVTLEEWDNRKGVATMRERREWLESLFDNVGSDNIFLIEQQEVEKSMDAIASHQAHWESLGFEGAMVKSPDAVYKFGRSHDMLKVKSFIDIDLEVIGFKEGTGKNVGKLGAVWVDHNGVEVKIGSGFDDEQRVEIWNNKDDFLGMTAECRYQEETEDGSLRFGTFVCWRLDK